MTTKILVCNFVDLNKEGCGGVINIQGNNEVFIKNCFFKNNRVSVSGGSFLLKVKSSILKKNKFIECFSSQRSNGYYGNAGVFNSGTTNIEHISTYKCGPSNTQYSDSAIKCNSPTEAKYMNASKNYGISGGSSISITINTNGSSVGFLNVVEPHDTTYIECRNNIDVFSSNFINTTSAKAYTVSATYGKFKFNYCYFVNSKSKFANRNNCWEATNCESDISISSMTQTTPKLLHFRVLFNKHICTKQQVKYQNKCTIKVLLFILIAS